MFFSIKNYSLLNFSGLKWPRLNVQYLLYSNISFFPSQLSAHAQHSSRATILMRAPANANRFKYSNTNTSVRISYTGVYCICFVCYSSLAAEAMPTAFRSAKHWYCGNWRYNIPFPHFLQSLQSCHSTCGLLGSFEFGEFSENFQKKIFRHQRHPTCPSEANAELNCMLPHADACHTDSVRTSLLTVNTVGKVYHIQYRSFFEMVYGTVVYIPQDRKVKDQPAIIYQTDRWIIQFCPAKYFLFEITFSNTEPITFHTAAIQ